jgi:UDPglucose 6-dehydrogenase
MNGNGILVPLLQRFPRPAAPEDRTKVAVIGTGYVGLVAAACLAALGHDVVSIDVDEDKIDALKAGRAPFYEPGLDDLIRRAKPRLAFTTDLREAAFSAQVVLVAVGTPPLESGRPDLGHVMRAAEELGPWLSPDTVVAIKSTAPVGTACGVEAVLRVRCAHDRFSVASNPEFLREGSAIGDFVHADRIVIGVADARAETALRRLYRPLTSANVPLLVTGRTDAELIKYAANGFLAIKVAFINEIADLCERLGGDVDDVARAIGMDKRIGEAFLKAGPGYGGSCFPKDTRALADLARRNAAPSRLVEAAIESNGRRVAALIERVLEAAGGSVCGKRVALLGLAFKPNTDDIRESPALALVGALLGEGALVRAYDPKAMHAARRAVPGLTCADDPYAACRSADIAIVMTDWPIFRSIDLDRLRSEMSGDLVLDFRNVFPAADLAARGFRGVGIGRPPLGGTPAIRQPASGRRARSRRSSAQPARNGARAS